MDLIPDQLVARRQWFERYFADTAPELLALHGLRVRYTCPCCGYPTLSRRNSQEICELCGWQDDGQDDFDADTVRGGPNYQYSLSLARENFVRYGTKLSPGGDTRLFPDSAIDQHAKRAIANAFELMCRQTEAATQFALWAIIGENEEILRHELHRRVDNINAYHRMAHPTDQSQHSLRALDSNA